MAIEILKDIASILWIALGVIDILTLLSHPVQKEMKSNV